MENEGKFTYGDISNEDPPFDEVARDLGLERTTAYVPANRSSAATRAARCRKKKEDKGFKQLNLVVPLDSHEALKSVAQSLRAGQTILDGILRFLCLSVVTAPDPDVKCEMTRAAEANCYPFLGLLANSYARGQTIADGIKDVTRTLISNAAPSRPASTISADQRTLMNIGIRMRGIRGWRRWLVIKVFGIPAKALETPTLAKRPA